MAKVMIDLPDDRWIDSSEIKPGYGEFCVVINRVSKIPSFCQYRQADGLWREDYFMSLDELFFLDGQGMASEWEPAFAGPIWKWKPLDLPEESRKSIQELIVKWLGEDEEDDSD